MNISTSEFPSPVTSKGQYLPECRAPPARRSLDLKIILVLPNWSCAVLIKLMQVGPNSIALVTSLGAALRMLGPADVSIGAHPSCLQWEVSCKVDLVTDMVRWGKLAAYVSGDTKKSSLGNEQWLSSSRPGQIRAWSFLQKHPTHR